VDTLAWDGDDPRFCGSGLSPGYDGVANQSVQSVGHFFLAGD